MAVAIRRLLNRSRPLVIVLILVFVVLWSFLNRQSLLIERYRQRFASPPSNTRTAVADPASASLPASLPAPASSPASSPTPASASAPASSATPRSPLVFGSTGGTNVTHQAERRRRRKITVELVGCARLGNHLFGHASMLGLADRHRLTPVVSSASRLFLSNFDSGIPTEDRASSTSARWKNCEEKIPSGYDEGVDEQIRRWTNEGGGGEGGEGVLLLGYFQSWRYFDHIRDRIVRHFRFKPSTAEMAAKLIESTQNRHYSNRSVAVLLNHLNGSRNDIVLVGIHVRRGDMMGSVMLERGYTVASPEYLKRAMALMEDRIINSSSSSSSNGSTAIVIVYVVVSDDIAWCRDHVTSQRFPVEYVASNSADVDLAILASCNHTILTVGSFGWWAAYLAGGLTVYYRDYPANGSQLAKGFRADDYFHPSWVGLS